MRERNQNRANIADKKAACDKIINPLIALPGSPGSGKSTFLVHLPESAAYQQYLNDTDRPAAIVSTLTFNSGMTTPGEADALGLRIIYGGMCAMLGTELFPMEWEAFMKNFMAQNITARYAVGMLRRLFGLDRPVLLLVDELIQATNDRAVMTELGTVLNFDGDCDVVVTALSPAYVFDLLTGSQRRITYVIMRPLLSTTTGLLIGATESSQWANRVNVTVGGISNQFKLNVLNHAYLLASGHPRSLEYMFASFEEFEGEVMAGIVSEVKTNSTVETLTFEIARQVVGTIPTVDGMTAEQLEQFVFTIPMRGSVENPQFRELLEKGTIFIYSKGSDSRGDKFITAVQARSFLTGVVGREDLVRLDSEETPRTREAAKLLQYLKRESVATWWERFVDTTIACRSYSDTTIEDLFGLPSGALGEHGFLGGCWNIGVTRLDLLIDKPRASASSNRLTVPAEVTLILTLTLTLALTLTLTLTPNFNSSNCPWPVGLTKFTR
jgi:hypothetical protein